METENVMTAQEKLKELKSQEAILKKQVAFEKKEAKEKTSRDRVARDSILAVKETKLNKIQKEIFQYKKQGKKLKFSQPILEQINSIIQEVE